MNTAYILSLIFSFLFLSPLPRTDKGMLVARFEIFVDPETRQATVETTYDLNCIPDDCTALIMLLSFREGICSAEEMQKHIKPSRLDSLPKLIPTPN